MLKVEYVNMHKHRSVFANKVFLFVNEYILGPKKEFAKY